METDELSQSQAQTVTSQDTRITTSTDTRISPGLPPGLFQRAVMRGSQSQQSQRPAQPILLSEISRPLDRMNRSVHLYEDNLAQTIDQEHLAFLSLPPQIQHLVRELRKVKRDTMRGARYIGTELERASGKCRRVVHGGPERSWSPKGGRGPRGPPAPYPSTLIHTF